MEPKDEDLIKQYQSGDQKAVEMIYQRYKKGVLNFCLRILGNRAEAEDITADTFVVLFTHQYTQQSTAKFSTWLFTVARNKCISRIRKTKNQTLLWFSPKHSQEATQWEVKDSSETPREELEKREASIKVKEVLNQLPMEQKEAIVLREYHGFSYEQISKILNCSLEKVKILIYRAREDLRGQLSSFIKEES